MYIDLHKFSLAALGINPVIIRYTLLHREYSQHLEVVDCTHDLTLLSSCD